MISMICCFVLYAVKKKKLPERLILKKDSFFTMAPSAQFLAALCRKILQLDPLFRDKIMQHEPPLGK